MYLDNTIDQIRRKYDDQKEFVQCVEEVFESVRPLIDAHPEYEKADLLMRMAEPDRFFSFRVVWTDDEGKVHAGTLMSGSSRPSTCSSTRALATSV